MRLKRSAKKPYS